MTAVPSDKLTSTERTLRGPVVDVLRTLLGDHVERDTVLSIVGELVARNAGSCRLAGVDPRAYLADVLPRLTGRVRLADLPALLPSRWARQHAEPARAAPA